MKRKKVISLSTRKPFKHKGNPDFVNDSYNDFIENVEGKGLLGFATVVIYENKQIYMHGERAFPLSPLELIAAIDTMKYKIIHDMLEYPTSE